MVGVLLVAALEVEDSKKVNSLSVSNVFNLRLNVKIRDRAFCRQQ